MNVLINLSGRLDGCIFRLIWLGGFGSVKLK